LEVETTAAGTDNSLTTIVELVEQAQAEKGDRARLADRIARPLVPGVLILAALVAVIGSLLGDPELWITHAPRRRRRPVPDRTGPLARVPRLLDGKRIRRSAHAGADRSSAARRFSIERQPLGTQLAGHTR